MLKLCDRAGLVTPGVVSIDGTRIAGNASPEGQLQRYRKRKQTVEPLFGNTKHNNGFYRFHRRGRIKVRLEWRLLMMSHNLTKVHRHQLATVGA